MAIRKKLSLCLTVYKAKQIQKYFKSWFLPHRKQIVLHGNQTTLALRAKSNRKINKAGETFCHLNIKKRHM
jgi:hypothetical protein